MLDISCGVSFLGQLLRVCWVEEWDFDFDGDDIGRVQWDYGSLLVDGGVGCGGLEGWYNGKWNDLEKAAAI